MGQKLLLTFLHYQRYLGLSDLDYSEAGRGYWLHATWYSYAAQFLVAGTFFSALVAALSEPLYYINTGSMTGNIFDNAVMMTASVTQLLANLWFRSQQQTQVALLQRLSKVKEHLQVDTVALSSPRRMYRLWVGTWFFYGYMVGNFAASFWLAKPKLSHALTLLGFGLRVMSANFQYTCYSGMVCLLQRLLRAQAEELQILVDTHPIPLEALAKSLRVHDEILMLGQREFVQVYGGVLLFLFLYQVMQCVLIFYVSTLKGSLNLRTTLTMSGWLAPMLLYLILPLMVNDVSNQFLHYQRYLGLSNLDYSQHQQRYTLHGTCVSYGLQFVVAVIFVSAFVSALAESVNYMQTNSLTGNIYDHAVILTVSVTQLLANLWFRAHQQAQVTLLRRLSKVMRLLKVNTLALGQPRWVYRLWVAVCLWYAMMIGSFGSSIWLSGMKLSHILTLLAFALRLLCANFQFTLYSSMVCVLQRLLSVQGELLQVLLGDPSGISREALARCLRLHDEILMLSQGEFVQVYGGVLLFLFLYQVMECVLIAYVSTLEGFRSMQELARIVCWISPMLVYLILPLMINDLSNQVSPWGATLP
ncbi:uncharacterized protein [Drosophila pseudoobscura]|uniref:Gustatory receptor n=1 Tax=Drosophila pseudoobscura pseudoobscura TaxID=46245 RepID=A0A6I8VWW1_DROPS|nr:uncharacterized protein LOC117183958 [Drosophila pseudoobscura]